MKKIKINKNKKRNIISRLAVHSYRLMIFLYSVLIGVVTNAAEIKSLVDTLPRFLATCPRWSSLRRILYTCRMYPVAPAGNRVFVNARARSACGLRANMSACRAAVTPHADRDSRPLGHRCMSRHCCYLAFHHSCLLCHSRDTCITDSCGSRFPRHWQVCFILVYNVYTPVVTWANWIFLSRLKRTF